MFPRVIDKPAFIVDVPSGRPPRKRPEIVMLSPQEVCRKLGWSSPSTIDDAQAYGFPKAARLREERKGSRTVMVPMYDLSKVDEWIDSIRKFVAALV